MNQPSNSFGFSRRQLLKYSGIGAAAVAGGSFLTACGGDDGGGGGGGGGGPQNSGGQLIHGATGGGSKDTIDPHQPVTGSRHLSLYNLYEPLLFWNNNYELEPALAESVEASADAMTWTVKMRAGATFHNGQPVTADDALKSIQRVANPDEPLSAGGQLSQIIDFASTKVVDDNTLQLVLNTPYAILDTLLAEYTLGIIPGGEFDPANPVGTGAFQYKSFEAGKTSTFTKFADYWGDAAFIDELVIQDFADDNAKVNAFQAKQIQTLDNLPYNLVETIKGAGGGVLDRRRRRVGAVHHACGPGAVRRLQGPPGDAADRRPPGDDRPGPERLRLAGQRHVRPARRRLRRRSAPARAGHRPGQVAARRGRRRRGSRSSSSPARTSARWPSRRRTSSPSRPRRPASRSRSPRRRRSTTTTTCPTRSRQDFWNTRNYIPQAVVGTFPPDQGGTYNETHWDNADHRDLVNPAARELDETKRKDLLHQAQEIEYNEGGLIIWGFRKQVDALRRQREGPRAEQVPPARQLQVQQGVGLT